MSYVNKNLMPGEKIEYSAKITRLTYLSGIILISFGFLINAGTQPSEEPNYIAIGLFFFGAISFLNAFVTRNTTEFVVTSKRVIYKSGFISRKTSELNHAKIESFHVKQGIFGRIFNYGTIVIHGTGGGKTPIPNVDSPLKFRKKAMEVMDESQK